MNTHAAPRPWVLLAALVAVCAPLHAVAQPGIDAADATEAVTPTASGPFGFAALAFATPVALQTGLGTGVELAWSSAGRVRVGGAVGWTMADEWSPSWAVTHQELRARATLMVDRRVGSGMLLAQLGAGLAVVRESRLRHQSWRTEGGRQETAAWGVLPLVTAHIGAAVRLAGPLCVVMTAGPAWPAGDANLGFVSHAGLGWMP